MSQGDQLACEPRSIRKLMCSRAKRSEPPARSIDRLFHCFLPKSHPKSHRSIHQPTRRRSCSRRCCRQSNRRCCRQSNRRCCRRWTHQRCRRCFRLPAEQHGEHASAGSNVESGRPDRRYCHLNWRCCKRHGGPSHRHSNLPRNRGLPKNRRIHRTNRRSGELSIEPANRHRGFRQRIRPTKRTNHPKIHPTNRPTSRPRQPWPQRRIPHPRSTRIGNTS